MPILHVQLKHTTETDLYPDGNVFNVQQSHRVKSQTLTLRRSIVTTNAAASGATNNPLIDGGNNVLLLSFSQNTISNRQIVSDIAGGGLLPIFFDYTDERRQCQNTDCDIALHIQDMPNTYQVSVFKSDGVTPFEFAAAASPATDANAETLQQIDLFFEYTDFFEDS
jgi:hypothetical protein